MKKYLVCAVSLLMLSPIAALADDHGKKEKSEPKKFTECAAVRMKEINTKHLAENNSEHFTQIPEGWTVISSAGGEGHPKVLLCR